MINNSGFSRQLRFRGFATLSSLLITLHLTSGDLPPGDDFVLEPVFPFPAPPTCLCPHSSVITRYRNINLLSIDYALRPRLRPRLTQGRSALPWKPWIFGRKDSHLPLRTPRHRRLGGPLPRLLSNVTHPHPLPINL